MILALVKYVTSFASDGLKIIPWLMWSRDIFLEEHDLIIDEINEFFLLTCHPLRKLYNSNLTFELYWTHLFNLWHKNSVSNYNLSQIKYILSHSKSVIFLNLAQRKYVIFLNLFLTKLCANISSFKIINIRILTNQIFAEKSTFSF